MDRDYSSIIFCDKVEIKTSLFFYVYGFTQTTFFRKMENEKGLNYIETYLPRELSFVIWEYVADACFKTVLDDIVQCRFMGVQLTSRCNDLCIYNCVREYFLQRPHFALTIKISHLCQQIQEYEYLDPVVRILRHYLSYGHVWQIVDLDSDLREELRIIRSRIQRIHTRHMQYHRLRLFYDDNNTSEEDQNQDEDNKNPICPLHHHKNINRQQQKNKPGLEYSKRKDKYHGKARNAIRGYNAAYFNLSYGMPLRRSWSPTPRKGTNGRCKYSTGNICNKVNRRFELRKRIRRLNAKFFIVSDADDFYLSC